MKVLLAPDLIEMYNRNALKANIKVNYIQAEKFAKFFTEDFQATTEALDQSHISVIVRFLLAQGKTKKEVAKMIGKDSTDLGSMLVFRKQFDDPEDKGSWTQKDLMKSDKYMSLRWTEEEFDALQAAHPEDDEENGWKLSKVKHLMLGIAPNDPYAPANTEEEENQAVVTA